MLDLVIETTMGMTLPWQVPAGTCPASACIASACPGIDSCESLIRSARSYSVPIKSIENKSGSKCRMGEICMPFMSSCSDYIKDIWLEITILLNLYRGRIKNHFLQASHTFTCSLIRFPLCDMWLRTLVGERVNCNNAI